MKFRIAGLACVAAMSLAGCASTGWRALRINGTSESTFEASAVALHEDLSPNRRLRFEAALQEIWRTESANAGAEGRAYEASKSYLTRLDGLGYEEVIILGGPAAKQRYLEAWSRVPGPGFPLGYPAPPSGCCPTPDGGFASLPR
jgi:hypothetical protein